MDNVKGMTNVRELGLVGKGLLCEILEDAGYHTVADIREFSDGDGELVFMRNVQVAIDRFKADAEGGKESSTTGWSRLGRRAYRIMRQIRHANLCGDQDEAPAPFRCGIMNEWMVDPVVSPAGISYDRVHIERWLAATQTDPHTREPLTMAQMVPNRALKDAIAIYRPLEERYLIKHRAEPDGL
jgi:hypothetical protein